MLSRRRICLMCLVLITALAGNVQAATDGQTQWTDGDPGDHLWSTVGNWDDGIPTATDWAKIRNGAPGAIIASEGTVALKVHVGYAEGGILTVDGGTLAMPVAANSDLLLGKQGGDGTLNMISGAITCVDLEVGGGNPGIINMTGGTINVGDDFMIPESAGSTAEVNLDGGSIIVDGDLTMGATGSMDITGGTLIVDGDVTSTINGYITSGWITAYEGTGTIHMDCNDTNPGKTTLTATENPPAPPGQATNPNPADEAVDQSINVNLSWTAGIAAVSHDVYFGTDSTPDATELQGSRTTTIFDPNTLAYSTIYYWRIDEVNPQGTTTGVVWSFTTEDVPPPPGQATNPSPAGGDGDQSIYASIIWTAGTGAVSSHDVYFGTDSTPDATEFQGNQTATIFNPGALANSTTYYWRIDEVGPGGTTTGVVWSFTTGATTPEIVIVPAGTDDDASLIQTTLDGLQAGDTLRLNGDFVIASTIYLPSNFTWILTGSLTLGDNAVLDSVGWVEPGIDARRPTGISETPGGATNIDMFGGTYYGNSANNSSNRFINFVQVTNSNFLNMTIVDATDDNFTIGPGCQYNECRYLISQFARGGGLTDKGSYNKWYDCIVEDGDGDGWVPKCRYSEFYRCIGRRNYGPGFGMFARIDGSNPDQGAVIENNSFYDCQAYENGRAGFSFNIATTSGEGAIIRNNFIQGVIYDNTMEGIKFRNKQPTGIVEDNEIDIVAWGNLGQTTGGGGLGIVADANCPVSSVTGSMVTYDNLQWDVNTEDANDCIITVYHPAGENPPVLKIGDASNIITVIDFNCSDPLVEWCMQKYCEMFVCAGLADFDCDGNVDIDDVAYMAGVWLTDDSTADIALPADGIVNLPDFSILSQEWLP